MRVASGVTFDNVKIYPQFFDLTLAYGAGNEPATVEQFKQQYPENYYAYTPTPDLLSSNISGIKTQSRNILDESIFEAGALDANGNVIGGTGSVYSHSDFIEVEQGNYYLANPNMAGTSKNSVLKYDSSKQLVGTTLSQTDGTFAISANVAYIKINTVNRNLGANVLQLTRGTTATPYVPYGVIDTLEFPVQTLRGALNAHDVMTRTGIERHIGEVDLGTLNWSRNSELSTGGAQFAVQMPGRAYTVNGRCAQYEVKSAAEIGNTVYNIIGLRTNGNVIVFNHPTITMTADFKTAMSGVILYYEVATPTTEPFAEPLDLTYTVQEGGTESWIVPDDTQSAAVTGEIAYPLSSNGLRDLPLACIAPIEGSTASANYAVGSYLIKDGQLWKVTTAIASGETIPASSLTARTVWQMVQEATA